MSAEKARSLRSRLFPALALALVLWGLSVRPAWALTDTEIEQRVGGALIQRHPTDTGDWWRELGPGAPAVIIRMFEKSTHPYHRLRLTEGLGWFDDARAVDFLKAQTESTDDDLVRNAAIQSVGRSQDGKELEFVAKYLAHADPQTRLAAAQALGRMKDPRARTRLEQYESEEKTAWIVARLKSDAVPPAANKLGPEPGAEERVNPAFGGVWRGYWVTPREGGKGLRSVAAVLRIVLGSGPGSEPRGELTLAAKKGKPPAEPLRLSRLDGKGSRLDGRWPAPSTEIRFAAERSEQAGAALLRLEVPQLGGTLLLRKDP